MPELPEIEAVARRIGPRLIDSSVTAVEINPRKGYMLRTPGSTLASELPGRTLTSVRRRGKHLILELRASNGDTASVIVNPMLGGRFAIGPATAKPPPNWVFRLAFSKGDAISYTDTRDMGRIYWTRQPETEVPGWVDLGPEADSIPDMGLEPFRKRLRRFRDELKDVLRNQAFLSGIGNAYSDEILFEAGILPLRRRATLKPEEEERLFAAIPRVLSHAIDVILANPNYVESKQDRSFMSVHGKGGGDCPRCGHRISQVGSDREPLNFCRGCQT